MQVDFKPRFDYARVLPDLRLADSGIEARWNDQKLFLQSPFPFEIYDLVVFLLSKRVKPNGLYSSTGAIK